MINWSAALYNSIKRGSTQLWNITDRIAPTWRRSTRSIGGYWLGTCEYAGTRDDLLEMFEEGMMREVREDVGGMLTWQGFIAEQQLTLDGVTYIRSMVDQANAIKCLYTRIGDNLLSNGGAESGAWTVCTGIGGTTGAATVTQSATWINTGSYSCSIVSPTGIEGARISGAGYAITITANTAYEITGVVNVVSGSWRISCNRGDTDASLCFDSTRSLIGERSIKMNIPATNTYAGTVDLRITSEASAGTIYGDSFVFNIAPFQSQTGWVTDANSIAEYGRMELATLEVAMSSAAANAKAATLLKKLAWPKALPPNEFTTIGAELTADSANPSQDKLSLTLHGYVHTLQNLYTLQANTAAANVHVSAIVNEAEFVEPGSIDANAMSYLIDSRGPLRAWQTLMDITQAGDASGNRWVCGVSSGRLFDYGLADNVIAYRYRGGKFYNSAGGELEPWFAEPGHLLYLDDMPVGPTQISGNVEDDPHVMFVSEVEMGPPTEQYPDGTLLMRHEVM
jgi:hypothetical protein